MVEFVYQCLAEAGLCTALWATARDPLFMLVELGKVMVDTPVRRRGHGSRGGRKCGISGEELVKGTLGVGGEGGGWGWEGGGRGSREILGGWSRSSWGLVGGVGVLVRRGGGDIRLLVRVGV